ncbi:MAG: hypothetical protein JNM39_04295, partial [Bdellovibrionaceae bacterium]|nr:hypothetical protein [Pseudobdellovibrionaceae bacterium]
MRQIRIVPCKDRMTSTTGIGLMVQTLMRSPVYPELLKHLPKRVSHRAQGSGFLALTLIAGHLLRAESVEDFEELQDDEYFPPKIELGRIWWKPSWSDGNLCFPIIVKRTWMTSCKIKDKKKSAQGS